MKNKLFFIGCSTFIGLYQGPSFAAPEGDLVIHNSSDKTVTAQVSTFGKFNIDANDQKNVSYSTLERVCSPAPNNCIAHFYVDDKHVGSARIDATTGKLITMHLNMKVHTAKSNQVLRQVVIQ